MPEACFQHDRSGLMGFSLIGVLLVSRWRLNNPSILKTGHFPSRYRPRLEHRPLSQPLPRLARSAFVPWPWAALL